MQSGRLQLFIQLVFGQQTHVATFVRAARHVNWSTDRLLPVTTRKTTSRAEDLPRTSIDTAKTKVRRHAPMGHSQTATNARAFGHVSLKFNQSTDTSRTHRDPTSPDRQPSNVRSASTSAGLAEDRCAAGTARDYSVTISRARKPVYYCHAAHGRPEARSSGNTVSRKRRWTESRRQSHWRSGTIATARFCIAPL